MSDTTHTLQLPGARLERIERSETAITLHFSEVHLVQVMEAAFEDTLWTQACNLVLDNPEIEGQLPDCPCEILGGDLSDNIYTYRDHAPLPIDWRGTVGARLRVAGSESELSIDAGSMRLEQLGHPRYIRHIAKI